MRAVVLLSVLALTFSAPALWWVGRAVRRGWRDRHVRGGLLRAALALYAALLTLIAGVALALLTALYGLGVVIAIVLSPLIVTVGLSAECLWDKHPQASSWLAAVPLALAALVLHRASDAWWTQALAAGHALLALATLLRARRARGTATTSALLPG